jgi:hypothetical protein|tara:strand:- start:605 stop:781 length:177 start_codon:yes stop_codon:yes gene_type:complete
MNWLKKRDVIPRWKFILWSLACILYGCYIVFMGELIEIFIGAFLILFLGWQTLFEKDK